MTKSGEKLVGVRGMNDLLPGDLPYWERFEAVSSELARSYGYSQIRTPIVEHTRLFKRSIGEVTDIVEKEMYSFTDALNGEELSLRPEGTAAVVRAVIEHNLLYDGPKRLWYIGPMFRHERPQRGRYRQFHQFGVEALGFVGPDIDAELILMVKRLWDDLGLTGIRLEINSIGQPNERLVHRQHLAAYFSSHSADLDADSRRRLETNPLRILDSKNPQMQDMVNGAPQLLDFLGAQSRAHFDEFQFLLRNSGIDFSINPRLVRGLDYYNLTVFEWVSDSLGAQGTVCGGGRYDPLIESMGGKAAPACGFALGIERLIELMRQEQETIPADSCDLYVVHQGEAARRMALGLSEDLRSAGFRVILHCAAEGAAASFKSQMKKADASQAAFAVILGDDELAAGEASVKMLRDTATPGRQERVPLDGLVDYVIDAVAGGEEFE